MTARSIHIGLNRIDPAYYGTEARLRGCINDANAMFRLAMSRGFQNPALLIDEQATSTAILNFLRRAAEELVAGDTLLATFAGHGSRVPDLNNDERTEEDQTWCAYDRMIVDDELAQIWSLFKAGVRIILVSDSCHSESIARLLMVASRDRSARGGLRQIGGALLGEQVGNNEIVGYRVLPRETAEFVDAHDRELYESIQRRTLGSERENIQATVITLSACTDQETAADGTNNGLYTSNLLSVWNDGNFRGGYRQFQNAIAAAVGGRQTPQFRVDGTRNAAFVAEQPFAPSAGISTGETAYPDKTSGVDYANTCRLELIMPYAMLDNYTDKQIWREMEKDGPALLSVIRNARSSPRVNGHVAASTRYRMDQNGVSSECVIRF